MVSNEQASPPGGRVNDGKNTTEGDTCKSDSESKTTCGEMATDIRQRMKNVPTNELYQKLEEEDLDSAHRIHPRDRRKIIRYDQCPANN